MVAGKSERLWTRESLRLLFTEVGLGPGDSVMVNSALSGFGYLINGPHDIVDSLLDTVGPTGTLILPTHTGQLTDPADWKNPPVPVAWVDTIRNEMAPFDARRTPPRNRGALPDYALRHADVKRSGHPLNSVAAIGAKAGWYTSEHPLHAPEGEGSPCHKLYLEDGYALLLGCGLENCTALHLAEYLADCPYLVETTVRVLVSNDDGIKQFVKLDRYPSSSDNFGILREPLSRIGALRTINLDDYPINLIRLKPAIDHVVEALITRPDLLAIA